MRVATLTVVIVRDGRKPLLIQYNRWKTAKTARCAGDRVGAGKYGGLAMEEVSVATQQTEIVSYGRVKHWIPFI
jgi:hypothetical protein